MKTKQVTTTAVAQAGANPNSPGVGRADIDFVGAADGGARSERGAGGAVLADWPANPKGYSREKRAEYGEEIVATLSQQLTWNLGMASAGVESFRG